MTKIGEVTLMKSASTGRGEKIIHHYAIHSLKQFQQSWVKSREIFNKEYKVIALIQVRNEKDYLHEVLLHLD